MGNVKITSKNQKGGITAQNVNISDESKFTVNESARAEGKLKVISFWVFGLIGATAALIEIVKYLS